MPDSSLDVKVMDVIRRYLTGTQIARMAGFGRADADAQSAGAGLGIENIRRGVLFVRSDFASSLTVVHGTSGFAPFPTPLAGEIMLSGRPLFLALAATVSAGSGGNLRLSLTLRGAEVTGVINGLPGTFAEGTTPRGVCGQWIVPNPAPGRARVEAVADAASVDGTVHGVSTDNTASLLAVEL